jgi:NSS family neurotransmitter:Na+ symporter
MLPVKPTIAMPPDAVACMELPVAVADTAAALGSTSAANRPNESSKSRSISMSSTTSIHGMWSSRFAFILAATGSAVGLGNIWRFPYTAGEYGGGAFVLVYLLCVAAIGIPDHDGRDHARSARATEPDQHHARAGRARGRNAGWWQLLGWMGILCGFLILSFYSVIAGWTLAYVFRAGAGQFGGIDAEPRRHVQGPGGDPERLLAWHTIFMVLTVMVVARGVASGLEKAVRWLMPALFVLLVVMVIYAAQAGDFAARVSLHVRAGLRQARGACRRGGAERHGPGLLQPEPRHGRDHDLRLLSEQPGLHRPERRDHRGHGYPGRAARRACDLSHRVGQRAGARQRPGLIFQTLPIAFGQMPGGSFFGCLFFVLLVFAAWTSAISLLEPMVAWLVENRGFSRVRAARLAASRSGCSASPACCR